ncbi:glycosyltransferase family 2 protein [Oricola nitratireducens]|uniref:glycosyltransferase family 2 protein n=1 Tax=Oricola nitratireducens TaxID=2775868 RepID=UPI001865B3F6
MSPEILTLADSMLFCAVAITLIIACASFLDQRKAGDRIIFGSVLIVMLLNYVTYRFAETLPDFEWTPYALWPRIYFGFEVVVISYTILSILFFFRRSDHSAAADASERAVSGLAEVPPVDVFICTYNEDLVILERTILAAKAIDYANFDVWVLDDGNRDWLRDYCGEHGVRYLSRDSNEGAKAGNINNGLRVSADLTDAPFILILDADFAPRREILKRTVGQFVDRSIGLIQTPQFYYNADPIQHNLLADHAWVDDQRIFFDVMQPSKDAWGVAFCVGTSCVVRRDALDAIGGMPQETVTEDIHLTYRLLQKGLKTRWLNERLSVGLSAESLSGYITQRCRWCLGTIQVALLRDGPFFGRGFTLMQRVHYFHGLLFWFCRPFILLMLAAPILYYFMGLPAILMEPAAFFFYAMPMVGGMWVFHSWVSERRSLPLFTEVSQMVAAVPITLAIAQAITTPFGRPFKVTAKGEDRSRVQVLYPMAGFFMAIIVLTLTGMVNGPLLRTYNDLDAFSIAWGLIVMVYAFVAMLVCIELPRPHVDEVHFGIDTPASLFHNGVSRPCHVQKMSVREALVTFSQNSDREAVKSGHVVGFRLPDGLAVAGVVAGPGTDGSAIRVGIRRLRDHRGAGTVVTVPEEIRRLLVARLFGGASPMIAPRAAPRLAVSALLRRVFGNPLQVMSAGGRKTGV